MRKAGLGSVFLIFLVSWNAAAFDDKKTHPELTSLAIQNSSINNYLVGVLALQGHTETIGDGKSLRVWLREGARLEDNPMCRATNHFHNPLREWTESGMRDQPWFVDARCTPTEYPPWSIWSAVPWATGYIEPSPTGAREQTTNQWNWDRAREYFYIYLTGKNYANQWVALTKPARDSYLASSFQALGQVLHLLQDMAVPAHVRDDFRSHLEWNGITPSSNLFEPTEWVFERFEYFVKKKQGIISGDAEKPNLQKPSLTAFWDTNQYAGENPGLLESQTLGLAEYANMNFVSRNTIFSEDFLNDSIASNDVYYHPYPRKGSVNITDYVNYVMLPQTVIAEDNQPDTRFYIAKRYDGEVIDRFLAVSYFSRDLQLDAGKTTSVFSKTLTIDDECAKNYAQKLLPRAVGYSAALLDYFFRGKIELVDSQLGYDPNTRAINSITLWAKNVTDKAELMTNGTIDVVVKHKNWSEQEYHHTVSRIGGASTIPRDEAAEFVVYLSEPIPIDTAEAQIFVVFRGMLGLESGGIGVGFKEVIGTLFDEEWDNGLAGNHSWQHLVEGHENGSGTSSNIVSDGVLWKSNLRYVGKDDTCYNESYLSLKNDTNPEGILIRPDTFVHFRIPRMDINQIPPALPGETTNWQAFNLMFNNGYNIQFSRPGQLMDYGPKTAHYYFEPSYMIVENIYDLFRGAGVAISEPLYLEVIDLIQQLLDLEEPSTIAHHQEMEMDYVRIIGRQ